MYFIAGSKMLFLFEKEPSFNVLVDVIESENSYKLYFFMRNFDLYSRTV